MCVITSMVVFNYFKSVFCALTILLSLQLYCDLLDKISLGELVGGQIKLRNHASQGLWEDSTC